MKVGSWKGIMLFSPASPESSVFTYLPEDSEGVFSVGLFCMPEESLPSRSFDNSPERKVRLNARSFSSSMMDRRHDARTSRVNFCVSVGSPIHQ